MLSLDLRGAGHPRFECEQVRRSGRRTGSAVGGLKHLISAENQTVIREEITTASRRHLHVIDTAFGLMGDRCRVSYFKFEVGCEFSGCERDTGRERPGYWDVAF